MNIKDNIWIGLAHVSSRPGNGLLGGANGAYVNILAIADNPSAFLDKVKEALEDIKLDFIRIEDIELFSKRSENYKIDKGIIELAIEVSKTKELRFGTFHTYDS